MRGADGRTAGQDKAAPVTLYNSPEPNPGWSAGSDLDDVLTVPCLVVDEAVLGAFYSAHVEGLLTYLTRKGGPDAAEDLANQVFEQFLLWWPDHPLHPSPVAALYRIAQCRLADHLRRLGRTLTLETRDLERALGDDGMCDEFAAVDLRMDLVWALAELTERERQALLLRHVAQLPVIECAEVLDLGIDNLKKILKKALATLRQSPRMDAYDTTERTWEEQW